MYYRGSPLYREVKGVWEKFCKLCQSWKPMDRNNFYWRKKGDRPYAYCKPCDTRSSRPYFKKARREKREREERLRLQKHSLKTESVQLLARSYELLKRVRPDHELTSDIGAHLLLRERLAKAEENE